MKTLSFLFFLSMFECFAQDISEINKHLNLSDTLEFKKEIRIYKDYSITNGMEIFRMYDSGTNDWKVEVFHYSKAFKNSTKIEKIEFPKENLGKLKAKDANLIWLNLLLCDIEYLPSLKDIDYKLKIASIQFEDGENGIVKRKSYPLDGESYVVFVKNEKLKNQFIFNNPDSYLKHYPNVDELISYNQMLSIISKEFNLWKN